MLDLAIHVRTGNLVPWRGASAVLPAFRQGKTPVRIRILDDNPDFPGGTGQKYIPADLTDFPQLRLGLWTANAFAEGTGESANLALATSSAIAPNLDYNIDDANDPYFEGAWNLATEAIAALTGKSAAVYFTAALVWSDEVSLNALIDTTDGATNAKLLAATDDGFAATPGATSDGVARVTMPLELAGPNGRVWILAYDATVDGPKFTEL